jgi:hypothetical protein
VHSSEGEENILWQAATVSTAPMSMKHFHHHVQTMVLKFKKVKTWLLKHYLAIFRQILTLNNV